MNCQLCGRPIEDAYEEHCAFWDDLMDAGYIDDALDAPWVYGNVCWQCANVIFMERYLEENPRTTYEEERRFDPSKYPWCDD